MVPKTTVALGNREAEQTLKLLDALEDLDDAQKAFTNADFPPKALEQIRSGRAGVWRGAVRRTAALPPEGEICFMSMERRLTTIEEWSQWVTEAMVALNESLQRLEASERRREAGMQALRESMQGLGESMLRLNESMGRLGESHQQLEESNREIRESLERTNEAVQRVREFVPVIQAEVVRLDNRIDNIEGA